MFEWDIQRLHETMFAHELSNVSKTGICLFCNTLYPFLDQMQRNQLVYQEVLNIYQPTTYLHLFQSA